MNTSLNTAHNHYRTTPAAAIALEARLDAAEAEARAMADASADFRAERDFESEAAPHVKNPAEAAEMDKEVAFVRRAVPAPRHGHGGRWASRALIDEDDEDENECFCDPDLLDHTTAAWLQNRLQELRGTPPLRLAVEPAPVPRTGWLLLLLLPLAVRMRTSEAEQLVARLIQRRNSPATGIWRPSDEEIMACACSLPDASPLGRTEELLSRNDSDGSGLVAQKPEPTRRYGR